MIRRAIEIQQDPEAVGLTDAQVRFSASVLRTVNSDIIGSWAAVFVMLPVADAVESSIIADTITDTQVNSVVGMVFNMLADPVLAVPVPEP
jgi:hypothetical protein